MSEQCKECRQSGEAVPQNLVRLQVTKPWSRQIEGRQFNFCPSPGCRVVYFTAEGETLTTDDLQRPPAYKTANGADLLCYCFQATGDDAINGDPIPYIRERVQNMECACDVLNPSGRCCLGSIGRWQKAHSP